MQKISDGQRAVMEAVSRAVAPMLPNGYRFLMIFINESDVGSVASNVPVERVLEVLATVGSAIVTGELPLEPLPVPKTLTQ